MVIRYEALQNATYYRIEGSAAIAKLGDLHELH